MQTLNSYKNIFFYTGIAGNPGQPGVKGFNRYFIPLEYTSITIHKIICAMYLHTQNMNIGKV